MDWSAAGEKTLSKWYVLLDSALGPIDNSTFFPRTPSVDSTTPLFSLTSRSLRPRHRTTTLMLVSSPASTSSSLAFLFMPDCFGGDFECDTLVEVDMLLPAGDGALDFED